MKTKRTAWIIGLCFAGLLVASSVRAALLTFDENGSSSMGLQSRLFLDSNPDGNGPAGGITTLDYLYPIDGNNDHVQLGWLVIRDPNDGVSDLIRFDSSTQVGGAPYQQIFFYSIDQHGDEADNWPSSSVVSLILAGGGNGNTATVTEDANGNAFYTPSSTAQPGYHLIGNDAGPAYTYEFISVPEPGSFMLTGVGFVGLWLVRRFSRKASDCSHQ